MRNINGTTTTGQCSGLDNYRNYNAISEIISPPLYTFKSKEAVGVNTRKAQYPPPPRISCLLEKHFLPNFINLTTITLHFALVA